MESSALLANIALIVAKDLLNDESTESMEPLYQFMFDDDDGSDEAECFFLQQQQQKRAKVDSAPKILCFNLLNEFDSPSFENALHLSKSTFLRLFESVCNFLPKRHFPGSITPQTAFSLSLWKMCKDEHFEEIARRFDVPFLDCQTAIRQFWKMISNNENRFIKYPAKGELVQQRAVGVVAIKRLDIFLESNDQEVEVIWQIVCNAEGKILDCFVQSIQEYDFDITPIGRALQKQTNMQQQAFLIGDSNFPLKPYLINPFTSPNTERELKFNSALESSLIFAQNIFDAMAKRFNALYALESKDLFEVRRIISSICCLHNLCVDINDDYAKLRQQETTMRLPSVNWSKPVQMEKQHKQSPSQEALRRRIDLLNAITDPEAPLL